MQNSTPFYDLHVQAEAKLVDFAGYQLPIRYPAGIIKEHLWTRQHCSLFDISHMGQAWLTAAGDPAPLLERVCPASLQELPAGRQLYALLLNEGGGIVDDFIVARLDDRRLFVVMNAACKENDFRYLDEKVPDLQVERLPSRAQLAVQGPKAEQVLAARLPECAQMRFMDFVSCRWRGAELFVARSGYTGEDGFEVSLPAEVASVFAAELLSDHEVQWAGLGARDSLRLEAGLCLYGHDLDQQTTPIEAGLRWTVGRRRRQAADFVGAEVVLAQLAAGVKRKRVGLDIEARSPCRAGVEIHADKRVIGRVSSGGFSPSLGKPIAMGYLETSVAEPGRAVTMLLRGREVTATVCKMPFVAHKYRM